MSDNAMSLGPFPVSPLWPFPPFGIFTASTPEVPELFWNVVSSEQRWKLLCCNVKKIIEYAQQLGVNVNVTEQQIENLSDQFDEFKKSGFVDYYESQMLAWINQNMDKLLHEFADVVFFGLTNDGRFCAFIPEGWKDIEFDTGMTGEKYGHLILRYDVSQQAVEMNGEEQASVIDNTNPYYPEV